MDWMWVGGYAAGGASAGSTGLAATADAATENAARTAGAILPNRIGTAPLVAVTNKRES